MRNMTMGRERRERVRCGGAVRIRRRENHDAGRRCCIIKRTTRGRRDLRREFGPGAFHTTRYESHHHHFARQHYYVIVTSEVSRLESGVWSLESGVRSLDGMQACRCRPTVIPPRSATRGGHSHTHTHTQTQTPTQTHARASASVNASASAQAVP